MSRHGLFLALLVLPVSLVGCGGPPQPQTRPIGDTQLTDTTPVPAKTPTTPPEPGLLSTPLERYDPPFRDWGVREMAFDSLWRIGPAALPALVKALHAADDNQRVQATRALARMGRDAKDAVPDLIAALSDPVERVRLGAVRALGQIGPDAEPAVSALLEQIEKTPPAPRREIRTSAGPAVEVTVPAARPIEQNVPRREAP